ncbi:unnamed protein product [Durusdinium trenchii]|uniref:Uncharacterized protein n=1 Tax=Durusdinium trenchii TaxID=1381693 RepID=A0ABP0K7G7_9DINO
MWRASKSNYSPSRRQPCILSEVLHLKMRSAVTQQTHLIDLDQLESVPIVGAHSSSAQHAESDSIMYEATCKCLAQKTSSSASWLELGRSTTTLAASGPDCIMSNALAGGRTWT